MIRLRPDRHTQDEIAEFVRRLEELARPAKEAIRPIQDVIRAGFDANFGGERGDDAPWAALALFTQRERRRLGFPPEHPILQRTGAYRASFTEEDHPLHVSEWSADGGQWTIEEGSRDERADHLEFGDTRTPARPVTILGGSGEARIATVLERLFGEWFEDE